MGSYAYVLAPDAPSVGAQTAGQTFAIVRRLTRCACPVGG